MSLLMKDDEQLQSDVEQELRWDPSIRAERIGVSVKSGVVELDGHVESFYEKWAANARQCELQTRKLSRARSRSIYLRRQPERTKTSHELP